MTISDLKLPPNNIEAEQSVIGGLLLDNKAFDQIADLKAIAFYQHDHAEIYKTIGEMLRDRKVVDIVTLCENLESKSMLTQIGGLAYIGALVQNTPTAANIKRYAEIVQEKYLLRSLISTASDIIADAYAFGDVNKKLDRAQADIMAITERTQSSEPQFVGDIAPERFERFDRVFMGEVKAISTGFQDLDFKLGGGLEGGQLIVVAARPAMGKSALAVQLAENIQHDNGAAVIFSCEMPNAQIVDRIISAHSKIPSDRLRNGKFTEDDFTGMVASIPKLKELNLLVDDRSFTINQISAKSRTIKRKHGLSVIVVDYLQLLEGSGDIREQQIASISRGLKQLAIELNVPIIALSQLNRKLEERADKRPKMSDIRESGAIEQDADLILGIYRDEEYNPDSTDRGTAELLILKNRSGSTGRVRLTFMGEFTRFADFSGSQEFAKKRYTRGMD